MAFPPELSHLHCARCGATNVNLTLELASPLTMVCTGGCKTVDERSFELSLGDDGRMRVTFIVPPKFESMPETWSDDLRTAIARWRAECAPMKVDVSINRQTGVLTLTPKR